MLRSIGVVFAALVLAGAPGHAHALDHAGTIDGHDPVTLHLDEPASAAGDVQGELRRAGQPPLRLGGHQNGSGMWLDVQDGRLGRVGTIYLQRDLFDALLGELIPPEPGRERLLVFPPSIRRPAPCGLDSTAAYRALLRPHALDGQHERAVQWKESPSEVQFWVGRIVPLPGRRAHGALTWERLGKAYAPAFDVIDEATCRVADHVDLAKLWSHEPGDADARVFDDLRELKAEARAIEIAPGTPGIYVQLEFVEDGSAFIASSLDAIFAPDGKLRARVVGDWSDLETSSRDRHENTAASTSATRYWLPDRRWLVLDEDSWKGELESAGADDDGAQPPHAWSAWRYDSRSQRFVRFDVPQAKLRKLTRGHSPWAPQALD